MTHNFEWKQFIIITLITSIWIHIGEVFRAFAVVFPRVRIFFNLDPTIARMDLNNAIIWGFWDTLLTAVLVFLFWLCAKAFGNHFKTILLTATVTYAATIGIFWIATVNMNLGDWTTALIVLPLAWIEFVIGAWIASRLYASARWRAIDS